ncbi:putative amidohydrolase [Thermosporothrix hazakensis]|jgi:predicted amidohydrolase|uniref:Hydrolase n=2 Tax=Thermosporothrix TaxID=768650 RepID=A0A455SVE8_9CHLR|nr:carbon-nitrogen hydrolase family protein [Thermosporothrix hazakensis]PZW32911.1 putative amidohydrolase [Thermosporothrix hazakensis]BBH90892.1 hydrolase [Thermosporothrix sp. COM3]GCE48943.1 hydrolase [Thermosporothrix hazakensis]
MSTLIAVAQLQSHVQPEENLPKAVAAINKAASRGAQLVVLPEIFMAWLSHENFNAATARQLAQPLDGPFVTGLRQAAREANIWVVCGTLETAEGTVDKSYNTTVVIDNSGNLVTCYRKTHLFDAFGYLESNVFARGEQLFQPIETPFGRMGLFVCYELRFPEVARAQAAQGADLIVVPAGWVNGSMKEVHWRNLVTARAIENTTYVVACNQVGHQFLGRSLIVDPMGVALAEGPEVESMLYAEIDSQRLAQVRSTVPSVSHRRPELYHLLHC